MTLHTVWIVIGATIGTLAAQAVVNSFTSEGVTNWQMCWFVFAAYALVVALAFAMIFKYDDK